MCIRDSAKAERNSEREAQQVVVYESCSGINEVSLEALEACLLYTSDAADERSSVDLGGRRIIKKKKHRHNLSRRPVET